MEGTLEKAMGNQYNCHGLDRFWGSRRLTSGFFFMLLSVHKE